MKPDAKSCAKALCQVLLKKGVNQDKLAESFVQEMKKKRVKIKDVLFFLEKEIRQKTGEKKAVVETARPISEKMRKMIQDNFSSFGLVETKVNPALVAGARITIDEELQFDGSFSGKIKNMFKN